MNVYQLRRNFTLQISDKTKTLRGKGAFKTREVEWVGTEAPVVIVVSIHSAFHDQILGEIKMSALISTIKNEVKGKVAILIAELAHLHTLRINNPTNAYQECLETARFIAERYATCFEGCDLMYWHSSIGCDSYYAESLRLVKRLFDDDPKFKNYLLIDAESNYNEQRKKEFPNRQLFFDRTIDDIIEMTACLLVLSRQGFSYQFYPGLPYLSTEYATRQLLPINRQIRWISVFLSIEKKTLVNH